MDTFFLVFFFFCRPHVQSTMYPLSRLVKGIVEEKESRVSGRLLKRALVCGEDHGGSFPHRDCRGRGRGGGRGGGVGGREKAGRIALRVALPTSSPSKLGPTGLSSSQHGEGYKWALLLYEPCEPQSTVPQARARGGTVTSVL